MSLNDILDLFGGIHWFLFIAVTALLIYHSVLKTWFYFNKQNVKFIRGLPFLGSNYQYLFSLENASETFERCYKKYPDEKFIGLYDLFGKPTYLIRDPELIKQMFITDFNSFIDHRFQFGEAEPLLGRSIIGLSGDQWKRMRATLTPAFSASKMRLMHNLMTETTEQFIHSLKEIVVTSEMVNAEDVFSRYSCDIIASCAFGMKIDSISNPENDFYKTGLVLSSAGPLVTLKIIGYIMVPKLMQWLNIPVIDRSVTNYFRAIVKNVIQERMENNIVRNDIIDLLIRAREGKLSDEFERSDESLMDGSEPNSTVDFTEKKTIWTEDDLLAQCMVTFIAGLRTVTNTLGFLMHELALNPDIQHKVFDEILAVKEKLNGQPLNYESVLKLKYLGMVINEAHRKWAPSSFLERSCCKSYVIENTDGTKVELKPGDGIYTSVTGLQSDEKYFPDADRFDPERFNDVNKDSIRMGSYMPFSLGPRNCIGSKFALVEVKTLIYYLLLDFIIERSERTEVPMQLKKGSFNTEPQNGFWIKLRRRN